MLQHEPRDIGILVKEIRADVEAECGQEIMEELFKIYFPAVAAASVAGFAEWYKQRLLEDSIFNEEALQ